MAEVDDTVSCPVCFEDYKEVGDSTPRILPCHHTLCEGCIKELIQDDTLYCPECRTTHVASSGMKSFTQNKYILANIKQEARANVRDMDVFEKCQEHGKEASLFCKEPTCEKVICQLCLIKNHKNHDVVDIEEETCAAQVRNIDLEHQEVENTKLDQKSHVTSVIVGQLDVRNKSGHDICVEAGRSSMADTQCRLISHMSLLSNNTVLIAGSDWNQDRVLKQYDLDTAEQLNWQLLATLPLGMTEVLLGGESTVALDFKQDQSINFRDVENLHRISLSYLLDPCQPSVMCTSLPTTLLYIIEGFPDVIRCLKCCSSPPKPATKTTNVTLASRCGVLDMCFGEYGNKTLVVVTDAWGGGIRAYNTKSGKSEWSVMGKLSGMKNDLCAHLLTTDGHSRIFVCDKNNECIHVFLATNGSYMGVNMRKSQGGLGCPVLVRWHNRKSSLIIAHWKDFKWQISLINVVAT